MRCTKKTPNPRHSAPQATRMTCKPERSKLKLPKNRLNPLPPSAQAIQVYGIDIPKLNADHFVSYKAAPVKIKYADGTLHALSTNLSFFTDMLHIKLKDIIIEYAGTAIKTDAIKGRHIVTAWNPANSTFSIDAKASLAPHLEAALEGNPNVDLAAQSPADSSKLVLLRLKITTSNEIHTIAKSNLGKQNDDAYFFFHIMHGMTLDAGYYTVPFAKHFRRFGLDLNGDLSITVTECDGGKRVQRTTKPDHPTNETEKRNHSSPRKTGASRRPDQERGIPRGESRRLRPAGPQPGRLQVLRQDLRPLPQGARHMRQPQLLQVPPGLPLRKRLPPRQQDLQLQHHARRLVERRVLVKRRRAAAPRAPEAHARPAENDPFWLVSGVSQAPPPRLGRERPTDSRSSLARLARYESPVPPPSGSHKPVNSKERPVRRKRKHVKKRIMDPCLATLSNSRRGTKNQEAPRRHTRESENYPTRDSGRKTQAKPPTPAPLKHLQASTSPHLASSRLTSPRLTSSHLISPHLSALFLF